MSQLSLGPFRLDTPLARGGMSEVWRAQHADSGASVAVKLLPRGVDDPPARAAFEHEVRAVARLDHPGIVRIVDHGRVSAEARKVSRGRLREGSPWMAMEYASGGTLAALGAMPDWPTARAVLLSVLDALAHAHARALVHRDIKPRNLLLCTAADDRPGLKLSDFGIAHAIGQSPAGGSASGTLAYMAPEQMRGEWREVGPWTDLYSLGCTAWVLLMGQPVFVGLQGAALIEAHLTRPPPAFEPAFDVPVGLNSWIRCLLAKNPEDRFKRSAEAAAALLALPSSGQTPPTPARRLDDLQRRGPVLLAEATTLAVDLPGSGLAGERAFWRPTAIQDDSSGLPEIPPTWRHPVPPPPTRALRGAGLGLLGMRENRVLGRDDALDRGWEVLSRVARNRRSEVLVVRGTAGVGRTRLMVALGVRAHELGVAEVFRVDHAVGDQSGAALWRMLGRELGCVGLPRPDAEGRVEYLLAPGRDSEVVLELVCPVGRDENGVEFESIPPAGDKERSGVFLRAVASLAGSRLPVLLLDDAHFDPVTLRWCAELLDRPEHADSGVAVIVTVRDDWVGEPELAAPLRAIAEHPRGHEVALERMSPGALHELLRGLLGLDASAAARVAEAAEGNPQVAVEVVRGWGAQGHLHMSEHGFALDPGTEARLPESLSEVWVQRAVDAVRELPDQATVWLERAAVLGLRVDRDAWKRACANPKLVLSAIEEELVGQQLARATRDGWRFRHAGLREALLDSAEAAGRTAKHHTACARALIARGNPQDEAAIGLHLFKSGDLDAAIDRLLAGAEAPGDQYRALDVLSRAEEAMRAKGLPFDDPRWGRTWVRRAGLCMRAGRYDEAKGWAERALDVSDRPEWLGVAVGALLELAVVALLKHDPEGPDLADRALLRATALGDAHEMNRARYLRAAAAMERRNWDVAEQRYLEALQSFRDLGDDPGAADCLRDLGNVALIQGQYELADQRYREALPLFERRGALLGVAHVQNGLADVARKQGNLEAAERGYATALELFDRVGAGQAVLARLNLGLVRVATGQWSEARKVLEATRAWMQEQRRDVWVGVAGVVLMPAYAGLRDWVEFDRAADQASRLLGASGFAQPDALWAAERAGELCRDAGQDQRAEGADQIARIQAERLGLR